jgi:glycolate oxidase FAD binding subunit
VVSLARLDRILRYEPGDFTIGVEAGARLSTLRETLAANGQEIALDVSSTSGGTLGGLVAAARPGPRRARHGAVRSHVIGVAGIRGDGTIYRAGGMVVKNVAGYEVMKFIAGSLGAAGIILEVNLKLRPLPALRSALLAEFEDAGRAWSFARAVRANRLDPAALVLLRGKLAALSLERAGAGAPASRRSVWAACILEGNRGAVSWQEKEIASLLSAAGARENLRLPPERAGSVLDLLCDVSSPGAGAPGDLGIARLSALPSDAERVESAAIAAALPEDAEPSVATDALSGLITLRWRAPSEAVAKPVARLEAAAREIGAAGVLVYLPPSERRSRAHLLVPDPNRELARRVLRAFDPPGVYYSGRTT